MDSKKWLRYQIAKKKKLKLKTIGKRDRSKYCHFHDDHGHTIDECRQLKDEIKRLIRDRHLRRFTRESSGSNKREQSSGNKAQAQTYLKEPIGIINVITGGPQLYMAQRILIDIGSLVNLITLKVYEKLESQKQNLTKVIYPLVGLGDKTIPVVGTINLIVGLGDETFRRSIYEEFMVVDIPLLYNVI
ncbi:hypothetical protein P3X46_007113 [Hevea brasiliensis]|uniref:Uncharacterized protein n=1 Tax=Hevea brasiliensis TaxID=3981 RepID=A0ABQ9MSF6_HEVBR|nr:hypothetical protein P3X46_007113 [Hevea brasiliensis]